jgi:hypothetical protein
LYITNGIFETGKIQSIGGAMIFKSSSLIKEWKGKEQIVLERDINLNIGDWIKISNSNFSNNNFSGSGDYDVKITNIVIGENGEKTITFTSTSNSTISTECDTVTYLCGSDEKGLINNLLIGINSNDNFADSLAPRAISFSELSLEEGKIKYSSPKMILGDLEGSKGYGDNYSHLSGFGLYGENVYLNGTLTTKVGNDSYAGVNTISGV